MKRIVSLKPERHGNAYSGSAIISYLSESISARTKTASRSLQTSYPQPKTTSPAAKRSWNRSVGTPRTEGCDPSSDVDKGVLFIDFMRSLIGYLSSKDPQALEYLEFHLRGFAQEIKTGALLPGPDEDGNRKKLNPSVPRFADDSRAFPCWRRGL